MLYFEGKNGRKEGRKGGMGEGRKARKKDRRGGFTVEWMDSFILSKGKRVARISMERKFMRKDIF